MIEINGKTKTGWQAYDRSFGRWLCLPQVHQVMRAACYGLV
jgi:hypothetical protein